MFFLGLVVALLVILLLGLTVLRARRNRPSPNAEMLTDLIQRLQRPGKKPPFSDFLHRLP